MLDRALPVVASVLCEGPENAGARIAQSRLRADLGRDEEAEQAVVLAMALDEPVDQQAGQATAALRGALCELSALLRATGQRDGWQLGRLDAHLGELI